MERFIGHVLSSHLALARSNKKMDLFISLNTNKCWLLPAIISPSLRLMMGLYGLLERERKGNPPPRNELDCSSLMICFRIPMKNDHFAMPKWLHTHSMGRSFVRELPLGKTNDIAQHLNIIAVLLIAGYNIKWNFCNLTVALSISQTLGVTSGQVMVLYSQKTALLVHYVNYNQLHIIRLLLSPQYSTMRIT